MNNILFIRLSTEDQAKDDKASIDMQINKANSYLKDNEEKPLTKDRIFIEVITGYAKGKPKLDKIKQLARKERFNLLVWAIDRLGRDAEEGLKISREFREMGINVISLTEPFDTGTPEGKFFLTMLLGKAELEGVTIKRRMLSGRHAKVGRDGTNFGSLPPFGYVTKDRRFVIVEDEAVIVRKIYELYLKYRSQSKIVEYFKVNGITARVKLDRRQIKRILPNVKYTGCMKVKNEVYPQRHPPIVSKEIFDKVQAIRQGNFTGNMPKWTNIAPNHILRDVSICGECGRQMTRCGIPSQKKTGGILEYYRCASKTRKEDRKKCPSRKYHKKESLESKVVEEIFSHIESLLSDRGYLRKHLKITSLEEISSIKARIESKNKTLKKKKRAIKGFLDKYEETHDNVYFERVDKLRKDINGLKDSIACLKVSLEKERSKKDDYKQKELIYKNFRKNWEEAEAKGKRSMINSLIRSIRIFKTGEFKIEYYF